MSNHAQKAQHWLGKAEELEDLGTGYTEYAQVAAAIAQTHATLALLEATAVPNRMVFHNAG